MNVLSWKASTTSVERKSWRRRKKENFKILTPAVVFDQSAAWKAETSQEPLETIGAGSTTAASVGCDGYLVREDGLFHVGNRTGQGGFRA
jgi:hypothetical protein